jgi:hypothetical protein
MIRDILLTKDIDVLVLDLELEGTFCILKLNLYWKTSRQKNYYFQWIIWTNIRPPLKLVLLDMFTNKKS